MSGPFGGNNSDQKANMNNMKRNLKLDFNQDKKSTLMLPLSTAEVLSSPDLNMLKVGTPELDNMILQTVNAVNTPTPSGLLFPKTVTEEQESFASGFMNVLNNLHNSNSSMNSSSQGKGTTAHLVAFEVRLMSCVKM